jgi:hypothetical protein
MKNIFIEEQKSHDSVDASGALIPGFVLARRYEVRGTVKQGLQTSDNTLVNRAIRNTSNQDSSFDKHTHNSMQTHTYKRTNKLIRSK